MVPVEWAVGQNKLTRPYILILMVIKTFWHCFLGGMGKADFREWIKADFREWSKADSTYAASQQTLFIVSGSPSNPILGEVT